MFKSNADGRKTTVIIGVFVLLAVAVTAIAIIVLKNMDSASATPPAPTATLPRVIGSPPEPGRTLPAPQEVCGPPAFQKNYWAVRVCVRMHTDGKSVHGRMTIGCYRDQDTYVECQSIRIREIELLADGDKLAGKPGAVSYRASYTTETVSGSCFSGTKYQVRAAEMTVMGPDAEWTTTNNISPKLDYQC